MQRDRVSLVASGRALVYTERFRGDKLMILACIRLRDTAIFNAYRPDRTEPFVRIEAEHIVTSATGVEFLTGPYNDEKRVAFISTVPGMVVVDENYDVSKVK